jgi:hypothetical protein
MTNKYYSERQIYASAFFGGPIPPGILIFKNFKRIGDDKRASISLAATFIFTILLFYGLMQLPDVIADKIPNLAFTALYTGIVYLVYHSFLAEKINDKIIDADNKVSNWNVAGITILGLVINLIIIFSIAFAQPAFPGDKLTYGEYNHEVFYDSQDFSHEDINQIGKLLYEFGYFQTDYQQSVRIEKHGDFYKLLLPVHRGASNDPEIISSLKSFKIELSRIMEKDVVIVLISYEINGDTITEEI